MKISVKWLSFLFLVVVIASCRKNKGSEPPPNPPDTSIVEYPLADPPSSIGFEHRNGTSYNINFDYSVAGQVNVKFNEQPAIRYTYADGYLQEVQYLNNAGNNAGKFTVQRSGNTINRVIVEHIDPITAVSAKDTMNVTFSGSAENTKMTVNGKYFTGVPVTVDYTYKNDLLKEIKGGEFGASVFLQSYQFTYDDKNRLALRTSDAYYGASYVYGDAAGSGLDSLYMVLGGKDRHFLEGIMFYDEYLSVFFYPLQIVLEDVGIELDAAVHRYGALREVRTVPNGAEYPDISVFTIQNTFDSQKRVLTSRVTRKGSEFFANYTITY